jgi:hypothetical protein
MRLLFQEPPDMCLTLNQNLKLFIASCSEELGTFPRIGELSKASNDQGSLELGLSQWKVDTLTAVKELRSMILKVWLVLLH